MKSTKRTLLVFFLLCFWASFSWAQTQKEDFSTLLRKAKGGDVEAMFQTAMAYHEQKNFEQAIYWYQKVDEDKNEAAGAWHNLGVIYYSGDGGYQNIEKAIYWFTKAANFGIRSSMELLGALYTNGKYIQADFKKGIDWLEMAASKDSNPATFMLAKIYYQEEDYLDFDKAFQLCLKSVSIGREPVNVGLLGKMYYKGEGTEVDKLKGMINLIMAARNGNAESYEFLKTLGFVD